MLLKGRAIQFGGRYIQDNNAIELTGSEVIRFGKKAFIIGGKTALSIAFDKIKESLDIESVNYDVHVFEGYSTMNQIYSIVEKAQKFDADVIVGIGGGRVMDTAKGVAMVSGKRIIQIPTSAAQCAAYATQSIVYSDMGAVEDTLFMDREVDSIIVDTNIIINKCPPRMLAAGIVDGMAKYPEINFNVKACSDMEKSVLSSLAMNVAKFNWDEYLHKGKSAVENVKRHVDSEEVEDIIFTNIALTGLTSSLASGGKQAAIAHDLYYCITHYFKEQQLKFLHGELVAVGLVLQMKVNGCSDDEIKQFQSFLRSIGVPSTLKDINLDATDKNLSTIQNHIINRMGDDGKDYEKVLWEGITSII